jgi:hypothetical protein
MLSENLPLFCISKVQLFHTVVENSNILGTIRRRKANWIGHILHKKAATGNIEYWKSKEEALARNLWRTRFRSGYGPVIRETSECKGRTQDFLDVHLRFSGQ